MQDSAEIAEVAAAAADATAEKAANRGAGGPGPALPRDEAVAQLRGLLAGETDLIANTANASAFLNDILPDINWVGFYFLRDGELVLGPFQGRPACVRIPVSRGVCGACVRSGQTQRVDDVHEFPGHIACDLRSRSELVVPLKRPSIGATLQHGQEGGPHDGPLLGVLDIDSPTPGRFSVSDQVYVETLVDAFSEVQFVG